MVYLPAECNEMFVLLCLFLVCFRNVLVPLHGTFRLFMRAYFSFPFPKSPAILPRFNSFVSASVAPTGHVLLILKKDALHETDANKRHTGGRTPLGDC